MVKRSDSLSNKNKNNLFSWFTSEAKKASRKIGLFFLKFSEDAEEEKPKEPKKNKQDKPSDVDKLPEPPKPQPTPEPVPELPQDPGEPFEIGLDEPTEEEPFEIGLEDPDIDEDFLEQIRTMAEDAGLDLNEEDLYDLATRIKNETDVNPYGSPNDDNSDDPLEAITTELKNTEVNNMRRRKSGEMLSYIEQMEQSAGTYTEYAAPSARIGSSSLKGKKYGADLLEL